EIHQTRRQTEKIQYSGSMKAYCEFSSNGIVIILRACGIPVFGFFRGERVGILNSEEENEYSGQTGHNSVGSSIDFGWFAWTHSIEVKPTSGQPSLDNVG